MVSIEDKDGNPLYMGRKTRLATRRQRRAALARSNGHCAYPGCERRVRMQVHHCNEWSKGGPTDIDQLVPLCPYHHRCVHEGGFRVEAAPGGFRFFRPDGRRVEEVPPLVSGVSVAELYRQLRAPLVARPWSGTGERLDRDNCMIGVGSLIDREQRMAG